jgi:hypothetical protein
MVTIDFTNKALGQGTKQQVKDHGLVATEQ